VCVCWVHSSHMLSELVSDWDFPSISPQDPAIQQAQQAFRGGAALVSLEDYNPFEEQAKPQLQINSTNTAAVVQPLSQNIPPPQTSSLGASAPSICVFIYSYLKSSWSKSFNIHKHIYRELGTY